MKSSTKAATEREMTCIHELGHMAMSIMLGREVKDVFVSKSARAKVQGKCVTNPSIVSTLLHSSGAQPDDPESVKLLRKFIRQTHIASEFDFEAEVFHELQIAHAGFCAELLHEVDRRCPNGKNLPTKRTLIALVKEFVSQNSQLGTDMSDDFSKITLLLQLHPNRRIHSTVITTTLSALRDSKTLMKQLLPKLMTAGKLSKKDLAMAHAAY